MNDEVPGMDMNQHPNEGFDADDRLDQRRPHDNAPSHGNRYRSHVKPLSHVENDRFSGTYKDSHGVQHVIDRKSDSVRRLDLLQVPGANRKEKKALLAKAKKQMKRQKAVQTT